MALDQYFEGKQSSEKWKPSGDFVADSDRNSTGGFDCNICLDIVQDPVVTLCGHLYCWPCIYKWLRLQSISLEDEEERNPQCPVCKSKVSQSSLVPLYGRGQTAINSEEKGRQVGIGIPRRPLGPRSLNASHSYHHHNPYHPQEFNSIPSNYTYTSPMVSTSGSLDNTFGIFSGMIYSRVFGMENIYTYQNSYNLSGNNNPRIRRHLMQVDKSLSRISFFLLCCLILCLLLF